MERDVQQDIKAMYDSVYLIDNIVQTGKPHVQSYDDVRRNYQHLEIMIGKDWIIDSGEDLTPFIDCITRAKTWLGE